MPTLSASISYGWSNDLSDEKPIVDLFLTQITPQYISHSELQGPRAEAVGKWRVDIARTLHEQVRQALSQDPKAPSTFLVAIATTRFLAGAAFVSIDQKRQASCPFAILEDIVVHPDAQGSGIGQGLLEWISDDLQHRGIRRLFIESGIENLSAHHFFEKRGFEPISVVMLKELKEPS